MRDYIAAVRAVWDCWQNRTPLDFRSERYTLNLMVPLFDPGPLDDGPPAVQLAAVNPRMCRVAGEVADGIRPHPVCTPSYIEEVMLPAVREGAAATGRPLDDFTVSMKPLVASAPDEERLEPKVRDARARIAFYASTPGYVAAFEHLGLGDLAAEAKQLSKAQRWEELPQLIDDDVLHTFVTIGTYDVIGRRLLDRFAPVVTHCEFSIAVRTDDDRQVLADLVRDVHAESDHRARALINGTPAP
jgi:probable F420-dependent oxidoreductase